MRIFFPSNLFTLMEFKVKIIANTFNLTYDSKQNLWKGNAGYIIKYTQKENSPTSLIIVGEVNLIRVFEDFAESIGLTPQMMLGSITPYSQKDITLMDSIKVRCLQYKKYHTDDKQILDWIFTLYGVDATIVLSTLKLGLNNDRR